MEFHCTFREWRCGLKIVLLGMLLAGCGSPSRAGGGFVSPRSDAVVKTDAEWASTLNSDQYKILRRQGTERPFTGKYWDSKSTGTYTCGGCGLPLFSSGAKFKSGTGWPSFTQPIAKDAIADTEDQSLMISRTEILCNRCGGHLGHVFEDGPPPTGQRYCVNGNALDFLAKEDSK
jgi:peptide-methionine (R)-S-oxide reductase